MLRLQGSWSSFSRLGFRLYGIRFMVYGSLGVALGFPAYGLRFSSPAVDQGELAGRHAGLAAGDAKRMSEMQRNIVACMRSANMPKGRPTCRGGSPRCKKKSLPRTGTTKYYHVYYHVLLPPWFLHLRAATVACRPSRHFTILLYY